MRNVLVVLAVLFLSACGSITEPVQTFEGGRFELVTVDSQVIAGHITMASDGAFTQETQVVVQFYGEMTVTINGTWRYQNGRVQMVPEFSEMKVAPFWFVVEGNTLVSAEGARVVYERK